MTLSFGVMQDVLRLGGVELFIAARKLGFDGVELCIDDLMDSEWHRGPGLAEVSARTALGDRTVPSACMLEYNRYGFSSADPAVRRKTEDTLERAIGWASEAGIPLLLIPFFGTSEIKNAEQRQRVVDGLRMVAPIAEQAGVALGIETTLAAADHRQMLAEIESPAMRVYYDVCNAAYWGHPIDSDLRDQIAIIAQIHLKDGRTEPWNAMLGEGFVDFGAVAREIVSSGYSGWLILESFSEADPLADAQRNLSFARQLFSEQIAKDS